MTNNLLAQLLSFAQNDSLEVVNVRVYPQVSDLIHHFTPLSLSENEFKIWGELIADNIILSWNNDNSDWEQKPIAVIDSTASPVSVIASNPLEFIQLLPFGIREIAFVADNFSRNSHDSEYIKLLRDGYNDSYFSDIRNELNSNQEYRSILNWIDKLKIPIPANPVSIIENAINKYPDFSSRMKECGLPF